MRLGVFHQPFALQLTGQFRGGGNVLEVIILAADVPGNAAENARVMDRVHSGRHRVAVRRHEVNQVAALGDQILHIGQLLLVIAVGAGNEHFHIRIGRQQRIFNQPRQGSLAGVHDREGKADLVCLAAFGGICRRSRFGRAGRRF